jgi:CheY-like chemotaxis protein
MTSAPAVQRGIDGVSGGQETILLADDEEIVGRLGRAILERYGYRVFGAMNGLEAMDIYRQRQKDIDLVILDMSMPKLSGPDTLRQLRALNPSVCVLISSGYCSDEDLQAVKNEGAVGFIPKPYRPADLARSVRTALDQKK